MSARKKGGDYRTRQSLLLRLYSKSTLREVQTDASIGVEGEARVLGTGRPTRQFLWEAGAERVDRVQHGGGKTAFNDRCGIQDVPATSTSLPDAVRHVYVKRRWWRRRTRQ